METAGVRARTKRGRFVTTGTTAKTRAATETRKRLHSNSTSQEDSPPLDPPAKKMQQFPMSRRRSIHLTCLTAGLSRCQNPSCSAELQLADCHMKHRYGLAGVLHVRCRKCSMDNRVGTDTRVKSSVKH